MLSAAAVADGAWPDGPVDDLCGRAEALVSTLRAGAPADPQQLVRVAAMCLELAGQRCQDGPAYGLGILTDATLSVLADLEP